MTLEKAFAPDTWLITKTVDRNLTKIRHRKYPFIQFTARKTPGEKITSSIRSPPTWRFRANGWSMNSKHTVDVSGRMTGKLVRDVFFESLKRDDGKEAVFNYLFYGNYHKVNV